jgi:chromosome segregation ATPase
MNTFRALLTPEEKRSHSLNSFFADAQTHSNSLNTPLMVSSFEKPKQEIADIKEEIRQTEDRIKEAKAELVIIEDQVKQLKIVSHLLDSDWVAITNHATREIKKENEEPAHGSVSNPQIQSEIHTPEEESWPEEREHGNSNVSYSLLANKSFPTSNQPEQKKKEKSAPAPLPWQLTDIIQQTKEFLDKKDHKDEVIEILEEKLQRLVLQLQNLEETLKLEMPEPTSLSNRSFF